MMFLLIIKNRFLNTQKIKIFKKRRKPRYVHQGSWLINLFSLLISKRIKRRLITKNYKNLRLRQLKDDLNCLKEFKYAWFIDVTNCFESCKVDSILRAFDDVLTPMEKQIIRLIYCSEVKNRKGHSKDFLRPGLQISEVLFELIVEEILKVSVKYNVDFASFVDDFRFYGNDPSQMELFYHYIKEYLSRFNLELYGEDRIDKNSGMINLKNEGPIGERLGVLFRNKEGGVLTKVRSSTKNRYLGRIKENVKSSQNLNEAIFRVRKILKQERFGIYSIFPYQQGLWTDKVDRKKFKIKVVRIIKIRFRTKLSGIEIFKLINADL